MLLVFFLRRAKGEWSCHFHSTMQEYHNHAGRFFVPAGKSCKGSLVALVQLDSSWTLFSTSHCFLSWIFHGLFQCLTLISKMSKIIIPFSFWNLLKIVICLSYFFGVNSTLFFVISITFIFYTLFSFKKINLT